MSVNYFNSNNEVAGHGTKTCWWTMGVQFLKGDWAFFFILVECEKWVMGRGNRDFESIIFPNERFSH